MRIYENERVADWMVRDLQRRMFADSGDRSSGPLHASDIYQCFRKVYQQRNAPTPYSKDAILKFAVGFALQHYFFGPEEDGEELFGIVMSTDRLVKGQVLEFKTTRKSYETYVKDEKGKRLTSLPKVKFDPEDNSQWVLRCRAYCAGHNVKKAHIGVFFLFQNELHAWTLEFSDADLEEGRRDIEERRGTLQGYLDRQELPPVSTRMGDWECGWCSYKENCIGDLRAEGALDEEA